jgi:hypothetical protein
MQVNDSPVAASSGVAGKHEVSPVADDGQTGPWGRSGPGFRKALQRTRVAPAIAGVNDGVSGAAMAGWFRPESASVPASVKATSGARVAATPAVDRVLLGAGPEGAQARVRIGSGALAGTEIQLSSTSGRAVEAQLLTHTATSRQTLSVVMDEIRSRLRDKGITLSTRAPAARPSFAGSEVSGVDGATSPSRRRPERGQGR